MIRIARFFPGSVLILAVLWPSPGRTDEANPEGTARNIFELSAEEEEEQNSFEFVMKGHRRSLAPVGFEQTEQPRLLVMTWFRTSPRDVFQCVVTERGSVSVESWYWSSFGREGRGGIPQPLADDKFERIRTILKEMPKAPDEPPRKRMVIVSFPHGKKWTTRIYDRATIPEEVQELSDLTGTRLTGWVPGIKPARTITLTGHDEIQGIAFSPDGRTLATADRKRVLRLWDATSGRRIADSRERPLYAPHAVTFSPDGRQLVSASSELLVWTDAATGALLDVRRQRRRGAYELEWSGDGRFIALTTSDGVVLFDAEKHESLTLPGIELESARQVRFSPDGKLLAAVGSDGRVRVWNVAAREQVWHSPAPLQDDDRVGRISFSPDGRWLVTAHRYNKTLRLWSLDEAGAPAVMKLNTASYVEFSGSIDWSPDGKLLAMTSRNGIITLWNTAARRHVANLSDHPSQFSSLRFRPDGKTLISFGLDQTIRYWDVATFQNVTESPKREAADGRR